MSRLSASKSRALSIISSLTSQRMIWFETGYRDLPPEPTSWQSRLRLRWCASATSATHHQSRQPQMEHNTCAFARVCNTEFAAHVCNAESIQRSLKVIKATPPRVRLAEKCLVAEPCNLRQHSIRPSCIVGPSPCQKAIFHSTLP